MKINTTNIEGVYLIEPKVFKDDRGLFFESFNKEIFQKNIASNINFVQDFKLVVYIAHGNLKII